MNKYNKKMNNKYLFNKTVKNEKYFIQVIKF